MPLYLVFMPDGAKRMEEKVDDIFRHELIPNQLWAIGSDLLTCADVCQRLEMKPEAGGVVVKFEEFYGLWDRALWDKLTVLGGTAR